MLILDTSFQPASIGAGCYLIDVFDIVLKYVYWGLIRWFFFRKYIFHDRSSIKGVDYNATIYWHIGHV